MAVALEEGQGITVASVEAGDLMMMTCPGARDTAPGEAQEWGAVALEEGAWEWAGWVWVTWATWEVWGEGGGQAPGAVAEEAP